jgi:hypothetical protein
VQIRPLVRPDETFRRFCISVHPLCMPIYWNCHDLEACLAVYSWRLHGTAPLLRLALSAMFLAAGFLIQGLLLSCAVVPLQAASPEANVAVQDNSRSASTGRVHSGNTEHG